MVGGNKKSLLNATDVLELNKRVVEKKENGEKEVNTPEIR
jgi:hypothetical protein